MAEKVYTEEELFRMRMFEAAMWLRDLKVGDTFTEKHMQGLERFIGPALKAARELKMKTMTFKPNEEGQMVLVSEETEK